MPSVGTHSGGRKRFFSRYDSVFLMQGVAQNARYPPPGTCTATDGDPLQSGPRCRSCPRSRTGTIGSGKRVLILARRRESEMEFSTLHEPLHGAGASAEAVLVAVGGGAAAGMGSSSDRGCEYRFKPRHESGILSHTLSKLGCSHRMRHVSVSDVSAGMGVPSRRRLLPTAS